MVREVSKPRRLDRAFICGVSRSLLCIIHRVYSSRIAHDRHQRHSHHLDTARWRKGRTTMAWQTRTSMRFRRTKITLCGIGRCAYRQYRIGEVCTRLATTIWRIPVPVPCQYLSALSPAHGVSPRFYVASNLKTPSRHPNGIVTSRLALLPSFEEQASQRAVASSS